MDKMDLFNSKELSKSDILKYLNELNEMLKNDNKFGKLYLYGGTVMALKYNSRVSTQDIDAIFDAEFLEDYLNIIKTKYGLFDDWINDDVEVCIADGKEDLEELNLGYSNLEIKVPSLDYMIAMKAFSGRNPKYYKDMVDLKHLIELKGINNFKDIEKIVVKFYPLKFWKETAQNYIKEMLGE